MSLASAPTERDRLASLLRERSLRRGDFLLSSGARSTYYIDARPTTMSGSGQLLIGNLGLALLERAGWAPSAVGGLTLGADPVAYAIAHAAAARGQHLDAFTVRKESKSHGTGRRIEGAFVPPIDVVVVEDVITTGSSALQAIEAVEQAGGRVLGVLAVVDRLEGGRDALVRAGHRLEAVFTALELLED
jgi:orotate phosphoribosyltransferase